MWKNWRTTLLGAITGLVMIIKGIVTKQPIEVIEGIGIAVTGALASDGVKAKKDVEKLASNDAHLKYESDVLKSEIEGIKQEVITK